jgi:hypothetical protein
MRAARNIPGVQQRTLTHHPGPGIHFHTGVFFFEAFSVTTWSRKTRLAIYTICDKNQLLLINTNIEKVTAVLVLGSWDAVPLGQVVPPGSDARWSLES